MKKNLILTKERHINATPLKVWTILTDNQWIEQWLGVQMITDWKPGSPIAFTFVYKDKEVKDKGTLLQFEPEKKLSYTYWSIFSATEDSPENYSEITLTITPNETGIVLAMTHVNFPSQIMVAHAEKNWEETLDTIKELAEEEANNRAFMDTLFDELQKLMFQKYPELIPYRDMLEKEHSEEVKDEIGQIREMLDGMIGGHKGYVSRYDYIVPEQVEYGDSPQEQLTIACHHKTLELIYQFYPIIVDLLPNEIRYINFSSRLHMHLIMEGFYFLTVDYRDDAVCDDDDD
jgi:uncharacterized protein YndB with AHSA1/START domain